MNMTEGNPTRLLTIFAIPMLIGNVFQQIYNLVDSIVVGKFVGSDALGAIGATSSVSFLFFALCNGISNGGGIITSQYFGANEKDKVKKSIANVAYLMLFVSLIVSMIAYASSGFVLRFLKTPDDIMEDALRYMKMQCIGVIFVAVYNYASSMLRALGDSRGPLYFLIFSSILNVFLDLLFVKEMNMSVYGAALATIISQFIAGIACLIYAFITNPYFHIEKKYMQIDRKLIMKSVSLGVPLSIQFSLIAISCMGMQSVVNGFGTVAVATYTAIGRIEQLVHQPYISLSTALSTYSGQNMGANRIDRIRLGYRKSLMLMFGFTCIILPTMQFCGKWILGMFVDEQEVISLGITALRITSWFYISLGMIYMARGILNGVGDSVFALINGIVEVIARLILPVVFTRISIFGVMGIWWSAGVIWLISAIFCVLRYVSWKHKV